MKKAGFLLTFVVLGLIFSQANAQKIETIDRNGLKTYLNQADDTTYVLNFWATWCKPCVEEMPDFLKLNREMQNEPFKMILISLDFPSQVESRLIPYIKENNIDAEVVLLDDPKSNIWIPLVNENWSGAIPGTLIYSKNNREFFEKKLHYKELKTIVKQHLKK